MLLQPGVLAAQSSDSATVDALANLVAAEQPLSLVGVAALNFGDIAIPDNRDALCAYDIASDGAQSVGENNQNFGEGPSPSQCAFRSGNADRAQFVLRCQQGQQVAFKLETRSVTPNGSDVFFVSFEDYIEVAGKSIYEWDGHCQDSDIAVRLGGQLLVRGTAQPSNGNVEVGTILLEAFYQ
ncbi:hypothetical protein [Porphyrobacter sp. AAP60]|uniref:hypothetical protein n=1 Tax=Porphyrobacter sp. AAP60 TaxID=1523423 RepID=UPI001F27A0B0|nr:hypothetical protein [Porphyrobacter sp. AAP60]